METKTKHTPGPWWVFGGHAVCYGPRTKDGKEARDRRITEGGCGYCNEWDEGVVRPEDATLIAAAPEMLEALQSALEVFDIYEDEEEASKLRKVIAKATGEGV